MGLPTRYPRGEQTAESHHGGCRAKKPLETGANKEEKGEAETIRSTLMGCLVGGNHQRLSQVRGGTTRTLAKAVGG